MKAVENDIVFVAGTGNKMQSKSTACPSLSPRVISVGGMVPECGCPNDLPPGACWIYSEEEHEDTSPPIICSMNGCGPGYMCNEHREDCVWEDMSEPVGNKPDILAPVHYPTEEEWISHQRTVMQCGTSFSTPMVAAQILNYIEVFQNEGIQTSPDDIRKAIRKSGRKIDESGLKALDGIGGFNELGDPYGIQHEDQSDEFIQSTRSDVTFD